MQIEIVGMLACLCLLQLIKLEYRHHLWCNRPNEESLLQSPNMHNNLSKSWTRSNMKSSTYTWLSLYAARETKKTKSPVSGAYRYPTLLNKHENERHEGGSSERRLRWHTSLALHPDLVSDIADCPKRPKSANWKNSRHLARTTDLKVIGNDRARH